MSTRKQLVRYAEVYRRRKMRVRNKVAGTVERPRLSVHRSLNNMYAQIIDDTSGRTLVAASTLDKSVAATFEEKDDKCKRGFKVGLKLAEFAKEKGIETVAFDRQGYLYHGRVKALAEGARKGGLKF